MANIQERRDKSGKLISYSIRVHRGRGMDGKQLKPWTATFEVSPTWTEKSARKKAEAFAATFEKECKEGVTSDSRQKFAAYCDYVIGLKEQRGTKHSTIMLYKHLTERIYPAIGHIKLRELRADHLNDLYSALSKDGLNKRNGGKLSTKTILEHHRLISTVLEQAVKEGLVPFNVASRATLPKAEHKEVNYFQPEQVAAIRDALEQEPMKWKTLVHLLLITGARRGEVLGLKWDKVDFEGNRIYICNSILYAPDIGIYESTPKTERSRRYVALPPETMQLLRQYRAWQAGERLRLGEYYQNQDFLFTQDNGKPMHPDSVTEWLKRFSKRHDLPHINPHAFRHTMASMLYFNGVDSVSISKRLGHAQVSTTANIYAHVMEEADQRNADILSDIFLKKA
ncbi:tyrosine-type recombinase/integrase [Flintibacter sp. KGMB00164]|uniref:tyrosine-type recombinase/integrase n=1 Tax=Flintibacter sp. KGMB00164 TaxID=2610895 RepID=UPI00177D79D7|nr:tyrosine-type recombinase/integrase [Flintibacter sp. KGMB00164]